MYYGVADISLLLCLVTIQAVAALLDGMPKRHPIAYLKEWSKLGYTAVLRMAFWFSLALITMQAPARRWPAIGLGLVHFTLVATDTLFKCCFLVAGVQHTTSDVVTGNLALVTKSYVALSIISMAQSTQGEQWNTFIINTSALICSALILAGISSIIVRSYS